MFSHVAMVNAIRLWKIIFIIFASFFGLVGIVLGIFLLLIEICIELYDLEQAKLYLNIANKSNIKLGENYLVILD